MRTRHHAVSFANPPQHSGPHGRHVRLHSRTRVRANCPARALATYHGRDGARGSRVVPDAPTPRRLGRVSRALVWPASPGRRALSDKSAMATRGRLRLGRSAKSSSFSIANGELGSLPCISDVVMARSPVIRFAAGTPDAPYSGVWRLVATGDDVYLGAGRHWMSTFKLSPHQSGVWTFPPRRSRAFS